MTRSVLSPVCRALCVALVASACSGETRGATLTTPPPTTVTTVTTTSAATIPPTQPGPDETPGTSAPLIGLEWQEVVVVDGFVTGFDVAGGALVVTTKDGRVLLVDAAGETSVLGDIGGRVRDRGEQGLLDLAVHPDHPADPRVFLHHSDRSGDTVLLEAVVDARPGGRFEVTGELLRVAQPASNHNGGSVEFGPDGMLYLALGDGGGSGDRYGHGQRTDTRLAAILRLDVSTPGVAVAPPDNPFVDGPAPEVWAWGLRNPWRITFDPPSGSLVVADVGQNRYEEVTVVPADLAGANHGWPITEGRACYRPEEGCDTAGLVLPVVDVAHGDEGTCSITGGVVYRGTSIPELVGHYLFTDHCGGWLRSFPVDAAVGVDPERWDVERLTGPAAFGHDPFGEVVVSGSDGRILRLGPVRGTAP